MYTLRRADRSHRALGTCDGVLGPGRDATFWILGWSPVTLERVPEQLVCTLVFPDGHASVVEVKQIDRDGGRIRFALAGRRQPRSPIWRSTQIHRLRHEEIEMPNYDVGNRAAYLPWHIPAGPPRPRAVIHMGAAGVAVDLGAMTNIALHADATGLYTSTPSSSSVFAILWRSGGSMFTRASLFHMRGEPDPEAVDWAAMLRDMGPEGSYYGVLANSETTVPSADFLAAVVARTPILEANLWVYSAESAGGIFSFGVDWHGFAGEPLDQG